MKTKINVKNMEDGYVQLTPVKGYRLFSDRTKTSFSEAIVKQEEVKNFYAVK